VTAVLFLGPTLTAHEAERLADATVLPPARQGDIYRAVCHYAPRAIGLIDGAFAEVRAVWHREILWALSQGVHVFGAASMGALRAVELAPFGMRGVGAVYQAYQTGVWPGFDELFEDDDEVAVLHAPPELGGGALSDAMVDLRETLKAAEAAGIVDRSERNALATAMKQLHFGARSFTRLIETAYEVLGSARAAPFAAWLKLNRVPRKRLDAIELIETVSRFVADDPPPFVPTFRMESTLVWHRFLVEAAAPDPPSDDERDVLEELRLIPDRWRETTRLALGRRAALAATDEPDADALGEFVDTFRRVRGLWRRADLDAWLAANALDEAGLSGMLREEAQLESAARASVANLASAMAAHLRLTGEFAGLLERARAKRATMTGAIRPPARPYMEAALDWFFTERGGTARPRSLRAYAWSFGWSDQDAFEAAVWRESRFAIRPNAE
jgi:hypothetical protein